MKEDWRIGGYWLAANTEWAICPASSSIFFKCSFERRLSAYILHKSSVPEGRTANQPLRAQTFSPPMSAPLPGAFVSFAVIGSPASWSAASASGRSALSAFFCSALAGKSVRE
jgi:hypothetical protein